MGSNPPFRLRIDRLRSCARRAAPPAAERRLLENLRQKVKSLDVNFLGKTIRAECIIGAYEAYSSRSVHSHPQRERWEAWYYCPLQMTAQHTPLGRRGRRSRWPVAPQSRRGKSQSSGTAGPAQAPRHRLRARRVVQRLVGHLLLLPLPRLPPHVVGVVGRPLADALLPAYYDALLSARHLAGRAREPAVGGRGCEDDV